MFCHKIQATTACLLVLCFEAVQLLHTGVVHRALFTLTGFPFRNVKPDGGAPYGHQFHFSPVGDR